MKLYHSVLGIQSARRSDCSQIIIIGASCLIDLHTVEKTQKPISIKKCVTLKTIKTQSNLQTSARARRCHLLEVQVLVDLDELVLALPVPGRLVAAGHQGVEGLQTLLEGRPLALALMLLAVELQTKVREDFTAFTFKTPCTMLISVNPWYVDIKLAGLCKGLKCESAFNQEKALLEAFSVIIQLQTSRRFV